MDNCQVCGEVEGGARYTLSSKGCEACGATVLPRAIWFRWVGNLEDAEGWVLQTGNGWSVDLVEAIVCRIGDGGWNLRLTVRGEENVTLPLPSNVTAPKMIKYHARRLLAGV